LNKFLAAAFVSLCLTGSEASAAPPYKPADDTLEAYKLKCQACHMADGNSPLEIMNFADGKWKHGSSLKEIAGVIAEGVPATAMLPFKTQLTEPQIQALARYVRSFDKAPMKAAPKSAAKKAAPAPTKQ
jgi:mono/diheme cytochrome c family protein